jgi:dolichyl-phosphate-mannose--protein O-mannosyl transferase
MHTKLIFLREIKWQLWLYSSIVLAIAYITYFHNYHLPAAVFWDENYHIASAQKYLAGIMYMEPHPPLGKLFIALGEYLLNPNKGIDLTSFVQTDYIKVFPQGYSFAGVRFFPTLFATGCALLFFLILFKISQNTHLSFWFSSLFLFENGLIVHFRSAMLESTQLFFMLAALLHFLWVLDKKDLSFKHYAWLGLWIGLGLAVKVNGLILILLFPFLFGYEHKDHLKSVVLIAKDGFLKALAFSGTIMAVLLIFFYIHTSLGTSLAKHFDYKASSEYKEVITKGQAANLSHFPLMLKDNFLFMKAYSAGVPRYDACKPGENGSLSTTWPFGNKSINYRWEKKDGKTLYLYLQGNPLIWFSGILGVILSLSLIISYGISEQKTPHKRLFFILSFLTFVYVSYMIVMFNIERVMYLYHYFIPLVFSLFIFFAVVNYIYHHSIACKHKIFYVAIGLFVVEIVWTYLFFSPLTYYKPLSTLEFMDRVWFDFWKLAPIL